MARKARKLKTPYAGLLPGLSDDEFAILKADIEEHGQQDPAIIDHEGNILDGMHRYKILGNKLRTQVLPGCAQMSEPERRAYAVMANLRRRQLSPSQWAEVERSVLIPLANELRWGPDWEAEKADPIRTEAQVGKMLNRPQQTIHDWTAKNTTITEAGKGCKARTDQKIPKADHELIWQRAQNGETQQAIADNPYKVSQQTIGKVVQKVQRQKDREAEQAARLKEIAEELGDEDDRGVWLGDFRELEGQIDSGKVDLIFTDPPYDRKTLPLYEDLARIGNRVLCEGGSLICYLGQFQIGEVLDLMRPHLRFWWICAVEHTGQLARMREYGVVVHWKPLLWFVKGTRGDKQTFVNDLVISNREKTDHVWQQSVIEASYYIEKLTPKGGLVFDPFCGGATTAVAAKRLGRRCITCDTDDKAVLTARKRLIDVDEAV